MLSEADVFHDRVVKEHHVLKYHGVVRQQHFRVHGPDIHAADLDRALVDVPQAGRQSRAGTLAGAGGANQSRDLAFPGRKAHATEHLRVVVREAHVFKHDIMPLRRKALRALGGLGVLDLRQTAG